MGSYIPSTDADRRVMLDALGMASADDLFSVLPEKTRAGELAIPPGMSEMELRRTVEAMARKNTVFPTIFRGAGAYRHYIPAAVTWITSNETFVTAYTPYQAEISQGILQSIFEYQTMICELTGMDASNASIYDGASAAAEAVTMCRDRKRQNIYISATTNPLIVETIRTYSFGSGASLTIIPEKDGRTDMTALASQLGKDPQAACVYVQQPNYYGLVEEGEAIAAIVHDHGAKLIAGVNPISLGVYEAPGVWGADIAVGEGQPLGMPLSFGGPYLGFITCKAPLMRSLPGRIVGETVDNRGQRAFVLTLQAREQHIRREKASSNVCTNQALCALTAAVYMSVMGPSGLVDVARQCHAKAHYAASLISALPGFSLKHSGEFFHEFVTSCPDAPKTLKTLEKHGILGGYPLEDGSLLWCVTEVVTKEEIDTLVGILKKEVL